MANLGRDFQRFIGKIASMPIYSCVKDLKLKSKGKTLSGVLSSYKPGMEHDFVCDLEAFLSSYTGDDHQMMMIRYINSYAIKKLNKIYNRNDPAQNTPSMFISLLRGLIDDSFKLSSQQLSEMSDCLKDPKFTPVFPRVREVLDSFDPYADVETLDVRFLTRQSQFLIAAIIKEHSKKLRIVLSLPDTVPSS